MPDTLPSKPSPSLTEASLADYAARARAYAHLAKADATRRAYRADLADFTDWCRQAGVSPLPASAAAVLAYLVDRAETLTVATLQRRLAALRDAHRIAGHDLDTSNPAFRETWRGLRRAKGIAKRQAAPLLTDELRRIVARLPDTLTGARDRAVLLLGFAGALRRSELVSLYTNKLVHKSYVEATADGLILHLVQSKTDQEGASDRIGVPFASDPTACPVHAYRHWLTAAGLTHGPVFRPIDARGVVGEAALSDRAVALIVQRAIAASARADGASAEEAKAHASQFSGHSLRAGLATSAAANNAPGHVIQKHLRHKKFETTAGYIRDGQLFRANAAALAGL